MIYFDEELRCFAATKKDKDNEDDGIKEPAFGKLTLSIRTRGKTRDRKGRPRYKKVTYTLPLCKGSMDKRAALNVLSKEMKNAQLEGRLSSKKLRLIIQAFKTK